MRRRSAKKWRPDAVGHDLVVTLLEAGAAAPNHHLTRPWRFTVFTGDSRQALGDALAASVHRSLRTEDEALLAVLEARARNKVLEAPVIITVSVVPSNAPKVREAEELHAGAAAAQNILVAAEALGLAALWRSGDAAFDDSVKAFLGLPAGAHVIGFLYLGWPEDAARSVKRDPSAAALTDWR